MDPNGGGTNFIFYTCVCHFKFCGLIQWYSFFPPSIEFVIGFNCLICILDAEASNAARKRKMKKPVVSEEEADSKQAIPAPPIRYFSLHPQPHFNFSSPSLPNAFRLDLNTQPKPQPPHQIPNSLLLQENADLLYPFKSSFTSLLTGVDDRNDLPPFVKEQNARVDQLITSQVSIPLSR